MTAVATIGVLWLATVLNFGGPKYTGSVSSITVWGVIIPCVGLAIVGWFFFSPDKMCIRDSAYAFYFIFTLTRV